MVMGVRRLIGSIGLAIIPLGEVASETCSFGKAELRSWAGPIDLRPQMSNSVYSYSTGAEVSATLFDDVGEGIKNYLAQDTRYDPERKRLEIDIDPSCRWSDGQPIIAQDFITGARIAFNENRLYPNGSGFHIPAPDLIKNGREVFDGVLGFDQLGIEAIDSDTIAYEINYPPEFAKIILSKLPYAPAPTHAHEIGDAYFEQPVETKVFSGPYKVSESSAEKLTLTRNAFFCSGIDTIPDQVNIIIGDRIATEGDQLLRQGINVVGSLPNRIRVALLSGEDVIDNYKLFISPNPSTMFIVLNAEIPALQDANVRQAIRLAVDLALPESGRVGTIITPKDTFSFRPEGYNPPLYPWADARDYPNAIKEARVLMEAAGYGPDAPLKLSFTGVPLYEYISVSQAFRSMYSQIYIDLQPIENDFAEYIERFGSGDYDVAIFGWYADYADPLDFLDAIDIYFTKSIQDRDTFRRLLDVEKSARTQPERYRAMEAVEAFLIDENFILPIGKPARIWLVDKQSKFKDAPRPSARDLIEPGCT